MANSNRIPYQVFFSPEEQHIFDALETARKVKGMTRKSFVMIAAANMVPEIAPTIVDHMATKQRTQLRKVTDGPA